MAFANWISIGRPAEEVRELAESVVSSLIPIPPTATNSRLMRAHWEECLLGAGWIKSLSVGNSRLSIGYARGEDGLCIQLGNTSRVYADLLKLETLYRRQTIRQAVLVVPSNSFKCIL